MAALNVTFVSVIVALAGIVDIVIVSKPGVPGEPPLTFAVTVCVKVATCTISPPEVVNIVAGPPVQTLAVDGKTDIGNGVALTTTLTVALLLQVPL